VSDEQQSAYKPTFTGELKRLIDVRGYNSARVASLIGCDVEYVLQVQRFNQVPTKTFATAADRVLRAEGSLLDLWQRERAALGRQQPRPLGTEAPEQADTVSPVKINLDQTRLELKAGVYVILRRLHITNQGNTPVTQLAAKVSVDRLPGNTAQSLAAYEADPLTWDELKLQAIYDHQQAMECIVCEDEIAYKEFLLLFKNNSTSFPLLPGKSAVIEYQYSVKRSKWGNWLQRTASTNTSRMDVELRFPEELAPALWGTQICGTAAALPFKQEIAHVTSGAHDVYTYSIDSPYPDGTYRIEWRFQMEDRPRDGDFASPPTATETMQFLNIVQSDDPQLHTPCLPLDLPRESSDAHQIASKLRETMRRLPNVHTFSKGMGLAAPQIGINRMVAGIKMPDGEELMLFNPTLIYSSPENDEQLEGCLSFFDVRGSVSRSLSIRVRYQDADGNTMTRSFPRGAARLLAHEMDHLNGILYSDRMSPEVQLIPVAKYRATGEDWQYSK
jgi:peptide deformylase